MEDVPGERGLDIARRSRQIGKTVRVISRTLARVIPAVTVDEGYRFADRIHSSGRAIVWRGTKELAEHYWEQLEDAGLTMAPLEQH